MYTQSTVWWFCNQRYQQALFGLVPEDYERAYGWTDGHTAGYIHARSLIQGGATLWFTIGYTLYLIAKNSSKPSTRWHHSSIVIFFISPAVHTHRPNWFYLINSCQLWHRSQEICRNRQFIKNLHLGTHYWTIGQRSLISGQRIGYFIAKVDPTTQDILVVSISSINNHWLNCQILYIDLYCYTCKVTNRSQTQVLKNPTESGSHHY